MDNHLSKLLFVAIFIITVVQSVNAASEIVLIDRGFEIESARLKVTIQDGVVIGLVNRMTGEIHSAASTNDVRIPRGVGQMTGNVSDMKSLHNPWGARLLSTSGPAGSATPSLHFPDSSSKFSTVRTPTGVSATWLGLTNGNRFFADEQMTIEATVDPAAGQVLLRSSAQCESGGVL